MNACGKTAVQNTTPSRVDVSALIEKPPLNLEQRLVTPAAHDLLKEQNYQPGFLFGWHAMHEAASISKLRLASTNPPETAGKPILTEFKTELGPVVVVTELFSDSGVCRLRTRMLLPGEQP